jgi:3-mercaptopyruvate sulfurtransferase SseA
MNSRKTAAFVAALAALLLMASCASRQVAETAKTPDWFFHDIVDAEFVQQYAKVPQPEGVMIIDSRPYKAKYVKGHIPTAVSIPDSSFDKMIAKLPEDKNAILIFYCGGPT